MLNVEIKVLNAGFIRLDGVMADDLSVVNSARVSFAKRHEAIEEGDSGLINFLMRERHGTPFEHNAFRFHIKAPIFVVREWQRHRIASYNEWSARYSQMEPEFYIPDSEDVRTQVGKPGAYTFEQFDEDDALAYIEDLFRESIRSFDYYKKWIDRGVAKEQTRAFLPVNIYTQMYWTVNARSLMNFLSLRNDKNAQWEIRQYAEVIEHIWQQFMPLTAEAFENNGRVAP